MLKYVMQRERNTNNIQQFIFMSFTMLLFDALCSINALNPGSNILALSGCFWTWGVSLHVWSLGASGIYGDSDDVHGAACSGFYSNCVRNAHMSKSTPISSGSRGLGP